MDGNNKWMEAFASEFSETALNWLIVTVPNIQDLFIILTKNYIKIIYKKNIMY